MRKTLLNYGIACLLVTGLVGVSQETAASDQPLVKVSGAYYIDSREFGNATIVLSSNSLPFEISLWGFSDFLGDQRSRDTELTRSFSEYRLSHNGIGKWLNVSGLGLQVENDIISGHGNDVLRAGVTYKHSLPLPWRNNLSRQGWLQWRYFPYQNTNTGSQASLIFHVPITDKLRIGGFADYNVRDGATNRWVAEPELSYRIGEKFFVLVEYRYNQFEISNTALDGSATALGIRYQF